MGHRVERVRAQPAEDRAAQQMLYWFQSIGRVGAMLAALVLETHMLM